MSKDININESAILETLNAKIDYDGGNYPSSGLETYINKASYAKYLNKNQITNCLLEVPQNIKLELNDGTLTLKAGSKVIVPNGVGVFKEVVVDTDRTLTLNWGDNEKMLLFLEVATGKLSRLNPPRIVSGTTNTYTGGISHIWYNTSTNKINWINTDQSLGIQLSLPFAMFTALGKENGAETPKVTSINQVFNGFGYIGSTIFVNKGVKGLIPWGRTTDGRLNNIEITTQKFLTRTFSTNENVTNAIIGLTATSIGRLYPESYSFDDTKNYINNAGANAPWQHVVIGTLDETKGVISNFQPKLPVHLVDRNEFEEVQVICETYNSGTSWYRVWSDGWCEQGANNITTNVTVTLLKPYKDTNYTVTTAFSNLDSSASANGGYIQMGVKTRNSFFIRARFNTATYSEKADWYACGYIA